MRLQDGEPATAAKDSYTTNTEPLYDAATTNKGEVRGHTHPCQPPTASCTILFYYIPQNNVHCFYVLLYPQQLRALLCFIVSPKTMCTIMRYYIVCTIMLIISPTTAALLWFIILLYYCIPACTVVLLCFKLSLISMLDLQITESPCVALV